jgi:hypothetical protein
VPNVRRERKGGDVRPAIHMKHPDDEITQTSPRTGTMFQSTALCRRKAGVAVLYVTVRERDVTCWRCAEILAKKARR